MASFLFLEVFPKGLQGAVQFSQIPSPVLGTVSRSVFTLLTCFPGACFPHLYYLSWLTSGSMTLFF